jgi:hypothetical protein
MVRAAGLELVYVGLEVCFGRDAGRCAWVDMHGTSGTRLGTKQERSRSRCGSCRFVNFKV